MDLLKILFGSPDFVPHGFCYQWNHGLLLLHVISDALIAAAYFSIPITLVYFVRKRRDLPFTWMFLCFGLFIVACGSTHLMEIWTLWHADYWTAGIVKAVTALASLPTAVLLVRLVPHALALPSPAALDQLNQQLIRKSDDLSLANQELQMTNQLLKQSQERYQLLFESNPHPVYVYDTETLSILDANSSAVSHYGYSRADFASLALPDIWLPDQLPALLQHLETKKNADGESTFWKHRKKDGHVLDVEMKSHPLTYSGKQATLIVVMDISERKRQEREAANRAAELEAANRELEAFSYSVSHDLRAPLRSIEGFSRALVEDFSSQINATGRDYLDRACAAAQRMGVLIDDLLNLSRVTRAEMHRSRIDLTAVAETVLAELRAADPQRDVACVVEPALQTEGDQPLIRIALQNLLGNAWKFTSKTKNARIEIGSLAHKERRIFFIRDNGAGFDPQIANRLFGPFQRLHATSEFPGTGIGLATVQRIVHRHGGKVWAEGAVGLGATFYFIF